LNTAKNIVIGITLLGVGYGAHVVLSEPDSTVSTEFEDAATLSAPLVDFDGARQLRPDVSLGVPADPGSVAGLGEGGLGQSVALDSELPPIDARVVTEPRADVLVESPTADHLGAQDAAPTVEVETAENVAAAPPSEALPPTPLGTDQGAVASSADPTDDVPSSPNTDELESLRASVQSKLDRGDLADALLALSIWYGDPNTTDQQRSEVLPLMDQLAGTVIYSRQHLLERQYTIQEGETLDQIAEKYLVPATLLAKINGITSLEVLRAGETLKVVRGPFRAEASMTRGELTLYLRHYYAGRFPISFGDGFSGREATLAVVEKLGEQSKTDAAGQQETPPENQAPAGHQPLIGLAGAEGTAGGTIGIHSADQACGPEDSHGCIRLDPQDAEDLHAILSLGSTVTILR
jgi:LysM repeat protein